MVRKISVRHLTPKVTQSGLYVQLNTKDTDNPIEVPLNASAVSIGFYDSAGALTPGRVGFSGQVEGGAQTVVDGDGTFGYQGPSVETYYLSDWCQVLHLASIADNVTVRGSWFYD